MDVKHAGYISLILTLTSCTVMYRPTLQDVPMFSKKGELQVSVANKNAAVSYSITPSIGIIASGHYRNRLQAMPATDRASNVKGYQRSLSLAIGYYKVHSYGSFEIFCGYGKGYNSLFFYSQFRSGATSNFNLFFVQPDLILTDRNKRAAYGFSSRMTIINFYDFKDIGRPAPVPQTPVFLEPGFTFRLKFGALAFKAQTFFSWPLSKPKQTNDNKPYSPMLSINGVLELHISDLFKGKRETARR